MIELKQKPKRKTEQWGYVDDNTIEIVHITVFHLNHVAAFVWELCDGNHEIKNIVNEVYQKYSIDKDMQDEVLNDILQILEGWKYDDLIIMNFYPIHSFSEYCSDEYDLILEENSEKDILLIFPPSPSPMSYGDPTNVFEPLGIKYIQSYLLQNGYSSVVSENFWTVQLNEKTILKLIRHYKPKIVGISAMTENFENGMRIAEIIKQYSKDIIVVCGGAHATYEDRRILEKYPCVDVVIRGEGEITFLEVADFYLRNMGDLTEIQEITYRASGQLIHNNDRTLIENLDSLPFPVRSRIRANKTVGIQTSRGCPGQCIFCCAAKLSGGRYRMRSAENVVSEIEEIYNRGGRKIFFQDDTVTVHIRRLRKIMSMLIEKKLDLVWMAESRVDVISKDSAILKEMKESGCIALQFGVESGSQEILDKLKKNITINQIYTSVRAAIDVGINVMCTFLIGHPFDTPKTILETFEFAKTLIDLGATTALSIVCPYPGTAIREEKENNKVKIYPTDFKDYNTLTPIMDIECMERKEIKRYFYSLGKQLQEYEREKRK